MDKEGLLKAIGDDLFDLSLKMNEEFGGRYVDIPEKYRFVLLLLWQYERLYVKDVAKLLHISSSSASQLLSKMEAEQYIVRELDPEQRRKTLVFLGDMGKKVLEHMEQTRKDITSKYFLKIPYEDLEAFHRILSQLKEMIQKERTEQVE